MKGFANQPVRKRRLGLANYAALTCNLARGALYCQEMQVTGQMLMASLTSSSG